MKYSIHWSKCNSYIISCPARLQGHDYNGEPGNPWPDVSSHFGVYDIAGFEKDTGAYYRSWWKGESGSTFVRVAPRDWTAPVAVGAKVAVFVFTGAAAAEAYVNGVSLVSQGHTIPCGKPYGRIFAILILILPERCSCTCMIMYIYI